MTDVERLKLLNVAVDLVMKGEFVASAALTNSIGEKPVWLPSADGKSLTFRELG